MTPALDRRAWLRTAAAFGLGLAGAGPAGLVGCDRRRATMRVHLDLSLRPGGAQPSPGLPGLRTLVMDHLECLGGLTVLPWPAPDGPEDSRSRACFLRLAANLGTGTLALAVEVSYANGMRPAPRASGPLAPAAAFEWLTRNLPLRLQAYPSARLCPRDAGTFLPLLAALADEDDATRSQPILDLGRDL